MKMLVCTDGSKHSQKTMDKASKIAEGTNFEEVAIIYVYSQSQDISSLIPAGISSEKQAERFNKMIEEHEEERKKILSEALKYFADRGIQARTILKEGHPSETIIKVAKEEDFDTIVIGSRGAGGLQKFFLGSVSNAVVQEAKDLTVIVVK